jgi:hypothetical protein
MFHMVLNKGNHLIHKEFKPQFFQDGFEDPHFAGAA